jgi:hypothetical protein
MHTGDAAVWTRGGASGGLRHFLVKKKIRPVDGTKETAFMLPD